MRKALLHQKHTILDHTGLCTCDTNCVKIAPAINKYGKKKRAPLPPEDTTHYASEGFSIFSC